MILWRCEIITLHAWSQLYSTHTSEDRYTQAVDNLGGLGCSSWPLRTRLVWDAAPLTTFRGDSASRKAPKSLSLHWDEFQPRQISWGLRKTQLTTPNLLSVISTAWSELISKYLVILPRSADFNWDWIYVTFLDLCYWNINISFFKQNLYFWLGGHRGFQ